MKRISGFFISLLLLLLLLSHSAAGQDTVDFRLRLGAGISLKPSIAVLTGTWPRGIEVSAFYDYNERITFAADAGVSRFVRENYNYRYENSGFYIKTGADYNLLNPVRAEGRYYAGIGARYGLAIFSDKLPLLEYNNYWGRHSTSAPGGLRSAHFLEFSPGIRAELFPNIYAGWAVSLRFLLYSGGDRNLRAVDVPGFGNGSSIAVTDISYFISIRIPYRRKQVIYIKREREIPEEEIGQTIR